jgi:hypothetical protein
MGFALLTGATLFLFDAHPSFRLLCCLFFPALIVGDMVSQNNYAREMQCITVGMCKPPRPAELMAVLDFWAWRDMTSMTLLVRRSSFFDTRDDLF